MSDTETASRISHEEVTKLARLALLDLSEEEASALFTDLNNILGYMQELEKVDISSVLATSHAAEAQNVFRDDIQQPHFSQEQVALNAPELVGRFFKVPLIIEG